MVVEGIDANPVVVARKDNTATKKKDDAFYTITDEAGNSLLLDVRERDKEKQDRFRIYSLEYNSDQPIILPSNHFNVNYQGKKSALNVKEQNFELKGEIKIKIKYDSKKNQSIITTRVNGQEKIKEIKEGLILLQLSTEKGTLKYSY